MLLRNKYNFAFFYLSLRWLLPTLLLITAKMKYIAPCLRLEKQNPIVLSVCLYFVRLNAPQSRIMQFCTKYELPVTI